MTPHQDILKAFVKLGDLFNAFCDITEDSTNYDNKWFSELNEVITLAKHHNGWFTRENITHALKSWAALLTLEQLTKWLSNYDNSSHTKKTVALIMAGNIPLVGFHDFLAVLITGNKALVKLSSNDNVLLPFLAKYLIANGAILSEKIEFTENKLENFDVVIATGSNNTARYFEHYFSKKPNIIRKNRNSVAILTGNETSEQLEALGEDIFRYYGLGCRSVSKLFVPEGYNFDTFFKAIYAFNPIIDQVKYANNYDYNKAVYLMSEFKILENGFLMLKEDKNYASPIASIFYEEYSSLDTLKKRLENEEEKLQCVVSNGVTDGEIMFGHTQSPGLNAYADGIDTVDFLLKI